MGSSLARSGLHEKDQIEPYDQDMLHNIPTASYEKIETGA